MLPGMGISEIIIIIVVVFIAFGPKQLHQIVYHAGRYWHKIQSTLNQVKTQLNQTISTTEEDNKQSTQSKINEKKNV